MTDEAAKTDRREIGLCHKCDELNQLREKTHKLTVAPCDHLVGNAVTFTHAANQ